MFVCRWNVVQVFWFSANGRLGLLVTQKMPVPENASVSCFLFKPASHSVSTGKQLLPKKPLVIVIFLCGCFSVHVSRNQCRFMFPSNHHTSTLLWGKLKVEPLLLGLYRRWFENLARTPSERLPGELLQACPSKRRP